MTLVPNWGAVGSSLSMANLKSRCDKAKPIGLVRCDADELLVVYDGKLDSYSNAAWTDGSAQ